MSDAIDSDLLRRLREGDVIASAQFCELYLPMLFADRGWRLPGVRDEHLVEEAAIEAVFSFVRRPHGYDPKRRAIFPHLRDAARADLKNLLAKEYRHARRRAPIEAVELRRPVGNDDEETPDLPAGLSQALLRRRLDEQLPDPRDRAAVRLILDRVRPTTDYARLYGLTHLPAAEQRQQVKRHKDRLEKVMKRLGMRLRDDT